MAPHPRAGAVWMGVCALAALAGAASAFVPVVYVDGRGYGGLDPALNDWLTEAGASTTGAALVVLGSLMALGVAAAMMRALDRGTSFNWRLAGVAVVASGAVTGWGAADWYRAIEEVFGAPEADLWGPGVPLAALAALINLAVGVVLMVLPAHREP